jgi:uncharacterized membrane protein YozB (DUF420 family)
MLITLKNNTIFTIMHRKAVFALAGIFLAVALIVPPLIFILQADHDLDNRIVIRDNPGLATSGNATITDETIENHNTNIIYAAIIALVFVILFVVALFYGINHPHPH